MPAMLKFLKDLVQSPEQKAAAEIQRRREGRVPGTAPARRPAQPEGYQAAEAALEKLGKRAAKPAPQSPSAKMSSANLSPERAALMRQAMDVRRAKQKIFDHLNDEDRARLVAMAVLAFMQQGRGSKS
jgi:hypothetical protein